MSILDIRIVKFLVFILHIVPTSFFLPAAQGILRVCVLTCTAASENLYPGLSADPLYHEWSTSPEKRGAIERLCDRIHRTGRLEVGREAGIHS